MSMLEQIQQIRRSLPPATEENIELREKLLSEARGLILDFERPDNVVERMLPAYKLKLLETAVVSIAIKMGLFKVLNKSSPCTVEDIASACSADPILVGRILRCLSSFGAVRENGVNSYSPTIVSHTFSEKRNEAAMETCLELLGPGWIAMPSFLEGKNWQYTKSSSDTAIAKAYSKPNGASFWEVLVESPHRNAFNPYMASFNEGHKDWADFYPVLERLGKGADTDPSSVMMVDVGGGLGHQAINLRRKFPQLPGRFIVQDKSHGLPSDKPSDVEFMEHDFNEEQPVKGARFYYFRYVPHDWPQDVNTHICTQTRKAMTPGYSRLLINEWTVPELGASKFMTAMDFNVLSVGGGMERTYDLHREYIENAGLKITKVFNPGDNRSESVIEAEVA